MQRTVQVKLDEQPRRSPSGGVVPHVRYGGAILVVVALMLGPRLKSADAAIDNGGKFFLLWPRVYQDLIQNWHIDFIPTSEKDYAYQIQIAGKDDENPPKLACDKMEANHYRSLALKDINGEFGLGSDKKITGKITANAQSIDIFGGWYNRFSLTAAVALQTHLRVAVYDTHGALQYTTRWFGAPEADILKWSWPKECAYVTTVKQ
jgi:hypothetical protein